MHVLCENISRCAFVFAILLCIYNSGSFERQQFILRS